MELVEDAPKRGSNIKVIGVGGGGGNAIDSMIEDGIDGVNSSRQIPTHKHSLATTPKLKSNSVSSVQGDWAQVQIRPSVKKRLKSRRRRSKNTSNNPTWSS